MIVEGHSFNGSSHWYSLSTEAQTNKNIQTSTPGYLFFLFVEITKITNGSNLAGLLSADCDFADTKVGALCMQRREDFNYDVNLI